MSPVSVLLIEDNPMDAFDVNEALPAHEGFVVDRATALLSGIEKAMARRYGVTLLDLGLPDSTGLETLREFRARAADVPVVVLTGHRDEQLGIEALRLGAQDYLVKGRDTESIPRAVRYAIEREEAQRRLANATRVAHQQERVAALGTIVAGVAHEINNPLTYIRGNVELSILSLAAIVQHAELEPHLLDEAKEAARLQGAVLEGLDRISKLSRSLRRLTRGDSNERRPVDLSEVAAQVAEIVVAEHAGHLDVKLDLQPVPPVLGDEAEIFQVFLNLLLNAVQALPRGGRVTIRTRHREKRVVAEVEDDGPGIPPEAQPHLFTPFFTTKAEGTGLGLSVSHKIATDHGGTLTFATGGRGTTFTLDLPEAGA